MKKSVVVFALLALVCSNAFARDKAVSQEKWTCKSTKKNAYVTAIQVTVDQGKKTSSGTLSDGTMSSDPIALEAVKGEEATSKLTGAVEGHDMRSYSVQLVPQSSDEFGESDKEITQAKGQAVVVYGGFIDCVGDVSGAEILSCDVELAHGKRR